MSMPANRQAALPVPAEKKADEFLKPSKKTDTVSYILGACILGAASIASLKVYQIAKAKITGKANAMLNSNSQNSGGVCERYRDNFLELIKRVEKFVQFGDDPLVSEQLGTSGIKLVNDIIPDTDIKRTRFFNKKGREFAEVFWGEDDKVFSYSIKDKLKRIIRTYNTQGDGKVSVYSYKNSKSLVKEFFPKE